MFKLTSHFSSQLYNRNTMYTIKGIQWLPRLSKIVTVFQLSLGKPRLWSIDYSDSTPASMTWSFKSKPPIIFLKPEKRGKIEWKTREKQHFQTKSSIIFACTSPSVLLWRSTEMIPLGKHPFLQCRIKATLLPPDQVSLGPVIHHTTFDHFKRINSFKKVKFRGEIRATWHKL